MQHNNLILGNDRLAVMTVGQGQPLLFVHGFPLDHTMWRFQWDEFRIGYQVITPDLRGFGLSNISCDVMTMAAFADDLAEMLNQLQVDKPVTLCGLSMGGYIGLAFAKKYPHLLQRLILCDTRAASDDAAGQLKRQEVATEVLQSGTADLARQMLPKLFAASASLRIPEIMAEIQQTIEQTSPRAVAAASLGMAGREDFRDQLEQIDIPTLVVCGQEDVISRPEEMEQIAASLPDAQFVIIPQAGHLSPLEQPVIFNQYLREFLARTDI